MDNIVATPGEWEDVVDEFDVHGVIRYMELSNFFYACAKAKKAVSEWPFLLPSWILGQVYSGVDLSSVEVISHEVKKCLVGDKEGNNTVPAICVSFRGKRGARSDGVEGTQQT